MGRLHPHGDTAIYDALVRMAQPFAMRLPLVDGHGNFGSLGGDDAPAAMRYTEARLAAAAMEMTASLDEDTVDFVPNYDGTEHAARGAPGRAARTCWSTARPGSRSGWPPTWPRTTSAR